MSPTTPPPLPASRSKRARWITRALVTFVIVIGVLGTAFTVGVYSGRIRSFFISTGSMAPALAAGDRVCMEGITHKVLPLRRGEVIAFKTDSIPDRGGAVWTFRVVGLPGDRLQLREGTLYVNDAPAPMTNRKGVIAYSSRPVHTHLRPEHEPLAVPEGAYFVLGDNSERSFDSRFWGFLPRQDVLGRIWFCYWPPRSAGWIQ
jgi:signal peptidase I